MSNLSSALLDDDNALWHPASILNDNIPAAPGPTNTSLQIVLTRFISNLMNSVYCSDGEDDVGNFDPARIRSQGVALSKSLIQYNGTKSITYLIFDIDRDGAAMAWEDANVPPPNLVCVNRQNGHAHLIYELLDPVWPHSSEDGRLDRAHHYLECIRKSLGEALGADPHYTGLLAKNPLHPKWKTWSFRTEPYRMGELHEHLDLSHHWRRTKQELRESDSRNVTLFDGARYWAYRHKNDYPTLPEFRRALERVVDEIHSELASPCLMHCRSVVKSVCKYWTKYHGVERQPKTPILSPNEVIERQHHAGETTRLNWKDHTIGRLRSAITQLVEQGQATTHSAISRAGGLSRRTVMKYREHVASILGSLTGQGEQGVSAVQTDPPTVSLESLTTVTVPETPTYADIFHHSNDNEIKTTVTVFKYSSRGVLVPGLPLDLQTTVSRIIHRKVNPVVVDDRPPKMFGAKENNSIFIMWNEAEVDDT